MVTVGPLTLRDSAAGINAAPNSEKWKKMKVEDSNMLVTRERWGRRGGLTDVAQKLEGGNCE